MATYNLPRLPAGTKIVYPDGSSSMEFATFWDQFARVIEKIVDDLTAVDDDLTQAVLDIQAAQADATQAIADAAAADAAAAAAQTDATQAITDAFNAQTTVDETTRDLTIFTGYSTPGEILTATDAGGTASITIDNHTRKYKAGVSDVSITGTTLTGLSFSTQYFIYYDDTTRSDTTPTFVATTDFDTASPQAADGRHYVGTVMTPADGAGDTSGGSAPPSAGGSIEPTTQGWGS
jgi:chemotaxis protein histidine kinase CheA